MKYQNAHTARQSIPDVKASDKNFNRCISTQFLPKSPLSFTVFHLPDENIFRGRFQTKGQTWFLAATRCYIQVIY